MPSDGVWMACLVSLLAVALGTYLIGKYSVVWMPCLVSLLAVALGTYLIGKYTVV